ncbi:MAG: hypothetical protein DRG69_00345 [Deltaproteobacteria bacterium]|nr:MAG: hypothetical protein DRG69_00345 [Deltaproteobacteria bacterium]
MKSSFFLLSFLLFFLVFCSGVEAVTWDTGQFLFDYRSDVYYQDVFGNEKRSFLKEGTHYLQELTGDLTQETVSGKVNFNAYFNLRSSDDPQHQIDERDVMFVQGYVRLYDDAYELQGGDYAEDYTSYTLGASLLGVRAHLKPVDGVKVYALWGRNRDEELDRYVRNTFGGRVELSYRGLSLGATFVHNDVVRSSLKDDSPVGDEFNQVFGGDLKLSLFEDRFELQAEYARSIYNEDERDETIEDEYDDAYFVKVQMRPFKGLALGAEFERVEPLFNTVMGSASPDMQRVKGEVELTPWDFLNVTLLHEYSFDKLTDDSVADYRTHTHMTSAGLTLTPFYRREDYWNSLTLNLQGNFSDYYSSGNVDQEDLSISGTISQSFTHWNYSIGYAFSRNWNHLDRSSEYESHSPSVSLGINYQWLSLQWNWSFNFGYEHRKALLYDYTDRIYRADGALTLDYSETQSTLALSVGVEHCDNSPYLGTADNTRWSFALNFDQVIKRSDKFTATVTLSSSYSDYDEDSPDADYGEAVHSLSLKLNF